jgi:hypothetical protein
VPLSVKARRYIPNAALCEGEFLETQLPLQAFATLTLPYHGTQMMLDDYFSRWTRCVQFHNRLTLGWIRAYETEPERHIHAVLVAAGSLDCAHAALIWREQVAKRPAAQSHHSRLFRRSCSPHSRTGSDFSNRPTQWDQRHVASATRKLGRNRESAKNHIEGYKEAPSSQKSEAIGSNSTEFLKM